MKITFRGAAQEVGRSCIDLESRHGRFLLDCGIALTPEGNLYPKDLKDLNKVKAVFLSHAHLDHSGALSMQEHRGLKCPIYCTAETKELSNILLLDSFHIDLHSHVHISYDENDIKRVMSQCRTIDYGQEHNFQGVKFNFHDACHIPGSASVEMEIEGKKLLYTGDINNTETRLLKSNLALPNADIMITECTYGDRNHPPRKNTEKKFLDAVKQTLANRGSVLVPAFAVGRAQEMLLLLQDLDTDVPVYLDGMAVKVTRNFFKYDRFIKDKQALSDAFGNALLIKDFRQRKDVAKQQGIFVTTSGMLTGGPVMEYLKIFAKRPNNSILLTGYQAEGTNGRMLMDSGKVIVDGFEFNVKCNYQKFDFSAHIGLRQLQQLIKNINPEKLILNHGDPPSIANMNIWAKSQGFKVYAPKLLQTIIT
ncbi:MBL fold metallo-hydrolase [Candidatus Woesearchaeota archaeon]|nr:MBL fold metallo-hydrolase [Candidatus Woesearchaeota archaeon]